MKKVLVLGCSGSGKSTFSIELGKITGLPVIHLDAYYWKPGWVATTDTEWNRVVTELAAKPEYIMDGNYSRTLDIRIKDADTIYYFDFPRYICLYRVVIRRIQNHRKTRVDMGEGCKEKIDFEFLKWIWNYKKRNKNRMERILQEARLNKHVVIFKKPKEVEDYLKKFGTEQFDT